MSKQGYKYWVAFEVRCDRTESRMSQHHTLFLDKQVKTEEDVTAIEVAIKANLIDEALDNNVNVKLTSWPHLLGRMDKPTAAKITEPTAAESPTHSKPFLKLAVNNVNTKEVIH